MKNKKHVIIALLIVVIVLGALCLTSCNKGGLDVPESVTVNADTLFVSWEEVSGADRYMLSFNGDESKQFMTEKTGYSLSNAPAQVLASLDSGKENTVRVRAVNIASEDEAPSNCSNWSEAASFLFKKQLATVTRVSFDEDGNVLKWRMLKESGAKYKLIIKEENASAKSEVDLADYTLTASTTTGLITLDITDILLTLNNKKYEISVLGYADGYDDSELSDKVSVDLTGGVDIPDDPEDPDDPDDPDDPEDPDDPDEPIDPNRVLSSISAFYTGGDVESGENLILSKITVKATYSDSSSSTVYDFTTNYDSVKNSLGKVTVTVTYSEKGVTKTAQISVNIVGAEADGYRILGIGGDWANGIAMTVNPGNELEYMYTSLTVNGTDGIKVNKNDGYYSTIKEGVDEAIYTFDGDGNIVLVAGTYNIYFNTVSEELWIEDVNADPGPGPSVPFVCSIRGVGGDWTTGIEMTLNSPKTTEYKYFNLTVNGTDGIKIVYDGNWYANVKQGVSDSVNYSEDGEGNIVLAAGSYDLYFDVNEGIWIAPHVG